jgi:hypothetical protein
MTTVDVTAILAAYLVDPGFTTAFDASPRNAVLSLGGSDDLAREISAIDLERLQAFRGLITKVQHNFLWSTFPLTLRHLRHHRLDQPLFTALATTHLGLRQQGVRDVAARVSVFVDFADGFLRRTRTRGALECSLLLAHEDCLRQVNEPYEYSATGDVVRPHRLTPRSIPVLLGRLSVRTFPASPLPLADAVSWGKRTPPVRHKKTDIAYWNAINGEGARAFAVTDLTPRLLTAVDGQRSVGQIVRHVTRLRAAGPFLPAFVKAAQLGLITFRSPTAASLGPASGGAKVSKLS